MMKKILSLMLVGLLINLMAVNSVYADPKAEKEARFAEKVKAGIAKLGTGREARIEVKLKDKTKLKGYVSQINENSFVVVEDKTGMVTEVPYPNAKQVKGNNLSKNVTLTLVLVGILAVAVILAATVFAGN